ncbi:dephospho-CoA kinase-like protein [Halodesulfurarchaeum formicicum]|uniref:UPF0201 protein HSR6_2118 n=1 Tax=Halodesulfurarchaeum formicicum TaxID=1873524 RepID=A0A1J1AEH9_9EURY|nr:dephospho-CoA kinase-like protein [Halodesulfurarchaeum formicicum]
MTVIGIVGLPGSGKSEAATVARELGLPVITLGDIVREETEQRGLDPSADHGQVAQALREEEGLAAIADRALPAIRDARRDHDAVVVDGIRSGHEVERFEDAFGDDFRLVAITAPDELRAERLEVRNRDSGAESGGETLADRDERELGFGIREAMDGAEVTIENDASLSAFRDAASEVFEEAIEGFVSRIEVTVEAPVNETEVPDRVAEAVAELFPEAEIEVAEDRVRATSYQLAHFRERLFEQRILDTARQEFFERAGPRGFAFELKKQAARQDVITFSVGRPDELGAIEVAVTVHEPDVETFIDHLAPATEDGTPLS